LFVIWERHWREILISLATLSCVCLSPGTLAGRPSLPSRPGNPVYGPRMQLYCRTGFHIGIFPSGRVKGINRDLNDFNNWFCLFIWITVEINTQVRTCNFWMCYVKEFFPQDNPSTRHQTTLLINFHNDRDNPQYRYYCALRHKLFVSFLSFYVQKQYKVLVSSLVKNCVSHGLWLNLGIPCIVKLWHICFFSSE
jgi:hypothetical protein